MKKFTKISLIIAAVLTGAGLLLCGIASVMGGGYGTIRQMARDGELNHGKWHINEYGIYYGEDDDTWGIHMDTDMEDDWDMDMDEDDWDMDTDIDVETKVSVETGVDDDDPWYAYGTADIKNLDIDIGAAELLFVEGTREDAIVVRLHDCKERYYEGGIEGDTLKVEYEQEHSFHHNINRQQIVVEIPAGMYFEKMDMDIGATNAKFSLADVSCDTLLLDVGAGNVIAEEFKVTERMEVSAGAGNVEIHGGSYKNISIKCGIGEFFMKGALGGNLTAECGMGNMELELEGDADAYNYDLSCGMGVLKVNGTTYSSIAGSHKVKNDGAIGTINLECGMGNLDLVIE